MPLLCRNCGLPLEGGDDAALFICPNCGLAHEPSEEGLTSFEPWSAAVTTELATSGELRYLAFWRVSATVSASSAWERLCRVVAPASPWLYVPAFTLMRGVVQRLGVSMTEAQPALELAAGLDKSVAHRPSLSSVGRGGEQDEQGRGPAIEPGFGTFSPVVVGREDARVLAHFVLLAVESNETKEIHSIYYELEATGEDLVFVPAIWDPRYIHESNWRLLLREFDGLVA